MRKHASARLLPDNPAAALEDLRQRHELQHRQHRLFLEISRRISRTFDLDAVLNHLLASLRSVVDYDAAGIFALNQDVPPKQSGEPLEIFGMAVQGLNHDPMLCCGKGIVGHVVQSGKTILVPDVRQDPRYVCGYESTLSEIAVPIVSNDRVIGALNLESNRLNAFSGTDTELLEFFANAAAIAIEKSLLHARVLHAQRIETQLRIAREVQTNLLPAGPPVLPGYDIAAVHVPTSQIGGDYYDYIPLGDGRTAFVVGDVAGKGVAAALIMASVRAMLRTVLLDSREICGIIKDVNRILLETTQVSRFVTAVYGVFDPAGGVFNYVNCGHNPPLLVRASGRLESLDKGGPVLGIFRDTAFETGTVTLSPGDSLALFTDGVVEVTDSGCTEFGVDRLGHVLREHSRASAHGIVGAVLDETRAFAARDLFDDDFTLVVVKRDFGY